MRTEPDSFSSSTCMVLFPHLLKTQILNLKADKTEMTIKSMSLKQLSCYTLEMGPF